MKIPKEAKCVFKGILFDVYQWKQKLFDGSYETFEMLKRKPTVDIIATVNDKIMILIQEQPRKPSYPSLTGGRIEENETPIEATKRELLEETGYEASNIKIIDEFLGRSKLYFHEYLIVVKNCKKVAEPELDPGEKTEVKFIEFDKFLELCRNKKFTAPLELKFMMYEALIDKNKKEELKKKIFSSNL